MDVGHRRPPRNRDIVPRKFSTLSEGTHVLTATASDSDGAAASVSFTLTVGAFSTYPQADVPLTLRLRLINLIEASTLDPTSGGWANLNALNDSSLWANDNLLADGGADYLAIMLMIADDFSTASPGAGASVSGSEIAELTSIFGALVRNDLADAVGDVDAARVSTYLERADGSAATGDYYRAIRNYHKALKVGLRL